MDIKEHIQTRFQEYVALEEHTERGLSTALLLNAHGSSYHVFVLQMNTRHSFVKKEKTNNQTKTKNTATSIFSSWNCKDTSHLNAMYNVSPRIQL